MSRSRMALGAAFAGFALIGVAIGFFLSNQLAGVTKQPGVGNSTAPSATAGAPAPQPAPWPTPGPAATPPTSPATPPGSVGAGAAPGSAGTAGTVSFVKLAHDLTPSVVHIFVRVGQRRSFYGYQDYGEGQGTGFIVAGEGYILTNDHVVGKASAIKVKLSDGTVLDGQVVGTDPGTDIALIKVDAGRALPAISLGDSDGLEIGEWVVAIGNPFGLEQTVTAGIVSAKGRRDVAPSGRSGYYDFIQTDASINPGNSGGPLINTRGEVVGINSAVSAQGQGIGFAIPINMVKAILPLLKQYHRVPRSWIGVQIGNVNQALATGLGLADTSGALVADVVPGSPAARAGIHPGDVILEFEGKTIKRHDDLPWLVSMAGIGRTVPVTIAGDNGKRRQVEVTLEEKPQ